MMLLVSWPVLAQNVGLPSDAEAMLVRQARQQTLEQFRSGIAPLEGAVNPNDYIVGPGDVFTISTGGALAMETTTAVTADGRLVVTDVGTFSVAGRSLAEAQERIRVELRRLYRNVSSDVALVEPRRFFVHVSGAVERPGRHVTVPIARVEDAVAAAMDELSPLLYLRTIEHVGRQQLQRPALRNVEVRRTDGTVLSVDLMRYYATGETDFNPYLLDGDRIFVPALEPGDQRRVFVEHETANSHQPGNRLNQTFDYRSDDTVTSLLLVKGGPSLLETTDVVRLLRAGSDGRLSTLNINIADIRSGASADVAILPQDRLLVPRSSERRGSAAIVGEVQHAGSYPIIDNVTTLPELVAAAGGIRPEALLRGAYLERRGDGMDALDRDHDLMSAADEAALAVQRAQERVFERERASYESARLSDLGFSSRNYLAREMIEFRRVSLTLGDDPSTIPDIPLRNGDRFVVPPDPQGVMVLGQVRHPGYVPVAAGAGAEYYVAAAGGRGPAATGTYVREAGTGYIRPAEDGPVRSGDVVFVDRQLIADTEALQHLALQELNLELQRDNQRRQARVQLVQMGVAMVSAAATIVTTYLFVTRN